MKSKQVPAKKSVSAVPAGYNEVTPYLSVRGASDAIDFYRKAFGAKEVFRIGGPEGRVGHAEIQIGGSRIMLADEHEPLDFFGPQTRGGTTVHIHVYVKSVDEVVERAVKAGAKLTRPVHDQFYGDRIGTVEDPYGHVWHIATHIEDVSPLEMKRRAAKAAQQAH